MITKDQAQNARNYALSLYKKAHIAVTPEEAERIEVADFGLSAPEQIGLQLLIYINTPRVCAKEMALMPHQTCPEHLHPSVNGEMGKEETFRCRWGVCYLYVADPAAAQRPTHIPSLHSECFTACKEIKLLPGEQYTIYPGTLHWFTSGDEGAVISEFSTCSRDEFDVFTDPAIQRATVITD